MGVGLEHVDLFEEQSQQQFTIRVGHQCRAQQECLQVSERCSMQYSRCQMPLTEARLVE
jgi:hypothetical protein